jgi:hypothetical protein
LAPSVSCSSFSNSPEENAQSIVSNYKNLTDTSQVESLGYAARAYGHSHPSSKNAYIVQTMLILLAPILFAATIYMFMGRLVLASGHTKASIIRPTWLTKIFLGGDILCFLVQAAGASFLVKTDASQSTKNLGKYIILAGLVIQLIVFGFFLVVAAIFHLRAGKAERLEIGTVKMFNWQKYMVTLYIVSGLVTVRNIFRVAEYVTGGECIPCLSVNFN